MYTCEKSNQEAEILSFFTHPIRIVLFLKHDKIIISRNKKKQMCSIWNFSKIKFLWCFTKNFKRLITSKKKKIKNHKKNQEA